MRFLELQRVRGARDPSACKSAIQDEMADTIGVARCIGDRDRATARHARQHELLEAGRIDDRLEVFDVLFETEIDAVPVRQAEAALIVSDQRVATRKQRQPRSPDRALPIEFEMRGPMRRPDKRRAITPGCIGDLNSVLAGAETDLLRRMSHRRRILAYLLSRVELPPQFRCWNTIPPGVQVVASSNLAPRAISSLELCSG